MILIDKHIKELVAGYNDILQAEINLRSRWRMQLLKAYTQRRQNYEKQVQRHTWLKNIPMIGWMVAGVIILVGIGIGGRAMVREDIPLLMACCGSPLLILLGILIIGALWFSRSGDGKTEDMPLHPLRENGIYPDLRAAWFQGLSGGLVNEIPDNPGHFSNADEKRAAKGKRLFVQQLMAICNDTDYVLAESVQGKNTEVDIILVGQKGVWVFCTNHWGGEIYWDDQGWRRIHAQSAKDQPGLQEGAMDETPDRYWIRSAAEVTRTLQERASDVLERYPELGKVRGGIVFTNPDIVLKIQPGRPTYWGKLNFWIKTLQEFEVKFNLDTFSTLEVIEALLERHHALSAVGSRRSMRIYAQCVLLEAEERLQEWEQG